MSGGIYHAGNRARHLGNVTVAYRHETPGICNGCKRNYGPHKSGAGIHCGLYSPIYDRAIDPDQAYDCLRRIPDDRPTAEESIALFPFLAVAGNLVNKNGGN